MKGLRYLGYLSLVIGLSLLGVVFFYYMSILSASIGILITDYTLYKESIGLDFLQVFNNFFLILFSLGSFGAILSYMGAYIIPQVIKE